MILLYSLCFLVINNNTPQYFHVLTHRRSKFPDPLVPIDFNIHKIDYWCWYIYVAQL